MSKTIDLDHVAIGVSDVQPHIDMLVGDLGGRIREGGVSVGFRALQVTLGVDGMTVELLEPWAVDQNDFLVRFLEARGEGPHHLTFIVPDLAEEIGRLRGLGVHPVQIDMSNPMWMECFVMPGEAHGTVVQLAQSGFGGLDLASFPEPEGGWFERWWDDPPPPPPESATLRAVVVASPVPEQAAAFFRDVMQGTVETEDDHSARLSWPGGGTIVIERSDARLGINRLVIDGKRSRQIGSARFVPES